MSDHECRQNESANRGCCGKCRQSQTTLQPQANNGGSMETLIEAHSAEHRPQPLAREVTDSPSG